MKITLPRDQLLEAVSWAAHAIPDRPVSPQLACLRLQAHAGLTVSAFDYEVSAETSVPAEVAEEGAALVPGRLLADIVRNLPARPAELTTDGTRMTLRCGASTFTLALVPDEAYPALPDLPPLVGAVGSAAFAAAISQVTIAAAGDDTLPVLTGVRIEITGSRLTLAATDKYRLAVRDLPWNPVQPDPAAAAMLIPAGLLNGSARPLASAAEIRIHLAGPDARESAGIAGFSIAGRQLTTRLISGEFPAYQDRIPAGFCTQAEIPVAPLAEAIHRVALVADRRAPIDLSVRKDHVTVAAGTDGQAQATEQVDVTKIDGDPEFRTRFDPQYLLDGLKALGTDTACIAFNGPASPAVLTGNARRPMRATHALGPQPGYRYILMPIRPADPEQEEQ